MIAVSTAQAYLAVITQRRQVEVEQRALENAQAHLDYADKRLQGGAGSRLNQVRAAQEVAGQQARLENARLALRRAQEALGVLLAADAPIDAGADPVLEAPEPAAEDQWMQARTDVRLQIASRQAAERLVKDAWRTKVGTAQAVFSPQYITPSSLFQPSGSFRFTVSFSQPIFDRTLVGFRVARRLAAEQASIVLDSIELQARADVRVSQEAVRSSSSALDSARLAATQAEEVLRITTLAFEAGATTNIEVIDAQRSARDAESTSALADDALRRARLDLLVALGRFPR
jgi:outer membrane protein TolC